jgi:hypothetical protein
MSPEGKALLHGDDVLAPERLKMHEPMKLTLERNTSVVDYGAIADRK